MCLDSGLGMDVSWAGKLQESMDVSGGYSNPVSTNAHSQQRSEIFLIDGNPYSFRR